jgi:hypothetical protein
MCKCGCAENNMDQGFLIRLDYARGLAGVPFKNTCLPSLCGVQKNWNSQRFYSCRC